MDQGASKMPVGGSPTFWMFKRAYDVVLAAILMPLFGAVALGLLVLNPFFNPGPLFFRQCRVGKVGNCFAMWKFRTMRPGGPQPRYATTEAYRTPPLGRWLRRYRLDELPQVINVLRGDMSFVGPRPEQPGFADQYDRMFPEYSARHLVRPGVSGLSQVLLGYTSGAEGTQRKLTLDLRYIRRSGYAMEVFILWRTLITVLTGRGAV